MMRTNTVVLVSVSVTKVPNLARGGEWGKVCNKTS